MILLMGPVLFVALGFGAFNARKAGLSRLETAFMVAVGSLVILVVTYGILLWGFLHFG